MSHSLPSLVHSASVAAHMGRIGFSITWRHSGAAVITFGVIAGGRWSAAVSFVSRSLSALGARHRVVAWGVRGHFLGAAVVVARGSGL